MIRDIRHVVSDVTSKDFVGTVSRASSEIQEKRLVVEIQYCQSDNVVSALIIGREKR